MTTDPLTTSADARPAGIDGYPGPFPVGRYAAGLRERLREFAHVCVIGEASGVRFGRGPNVYFELRDGDGGLPCAMWRDDFERSGLSEDDFRDGVEVVAAGGCDYYTGGPTASPRFTFRVKELRLAGEGDLLARLERLRRRLAEEGLFERQKLLARAVLPRRIGVVTAETGAARRDFLAGLERRGWRGTIVWGYAPVQDRRAAGAITRAIQDLAAVGEVETIVVTRGGGSIADLWAFCDETLCRTVALLPVPVISAVGHHVDRTLIDDVAAVCCSTPTHAAEAAVAVDCRAARVALAEKAARIERRGRALLLERGRMLEAARRIDARGRAAVLDRARALAAFSRAPREHVSGHRRQLHQKTREMRAASRRGLAARGDYQRRIAAAVIGRKRDAAASAAATGSARLNARAAALARAAAALEERRREALRAHAAAIRAHDPDRTLERGYAIALDADGRPLGSAAAVREAFEFELRMADGSVLGRMREEVEE